jgi:DNA adenine methylase
MHGGALLKNSGNKDEKLVPFVKWAGGKRQLLCTIKGFSPKSFGRYIEPFVGGGVVYLTLRPTQALLSDTNIDLIDCYAVIREHVDELIETLCTYAPHVLDEQFYYQVRSQDASKLCAVERAARFIFLNKTCYNGLYRVNSSGHFNVPFGKHDRPPYLFDEVNLRSISQLLRSAELLACDFEKTAVTASKGDFVYFDPPYHHPTNSHFTAYSINGFCEKDHVRLATIFHMLHKRECKVLLSNSATNFVFELYKDFTIIPVMTNQPINCIASKRRNFQQVLIMNYEPDF